MHNFFVASAAKERKELNERPKSTDLGLNRSRCSSSKSSIAVYVSPFERLVTYHAT